MTETPTAEQAPEEHTAAGRSTSARWWALGVCVVTAVYSLLPLLGSYRFFMRGDTAAQFAPIWFHLGDLVRAGNWPPVIDADAWAGGNYAGEALFGVYNPLNVLIWLGVSYSPDLLVAVTLVKCCILVLLALGVHLLCREYGAAPWAAAAVATAIPFSGFTLYWDAGSWPSGLLAFAYAPWVWWIFRRVLRQRANPIWGFVVGALAVTQGNPYGTLAVAVIGAGLLVEGILGGNWRGVTRLAALGACVAAFLPLVYIPLLEASDLSYRNAPALFANNGKLRPRVSDLLFASAPTYVPRFQAIIGEMKVPGTYFCWFLLPLLPWLRFRVLRDRWRELSAVGVIGVCYLLLTTGPARLWLFRWPLRLIEYFYLTIGILLAVTLSQGFARDRRRARTVATGLIVVALGFITWAEDPARLRAAAAGTLILAVLSGLLVVWVRREAVALGLVGLLLVGGTGLVLVSQSLIFGENASSRPWRFPNDVSALEEQFSSLDGQTIQFARFDRRQPDDGQRISRHWDSFLAGSMYQVAGVDAVNNYTGMGYGRFWKSLCMSYEGYTKPCGYRKVWKPVRKGGAPLVDLLKLETMVVQPKQAKGVTPLPGWETVEAGEAIVLERSDPLPYPDSRLSFASPSIDVSSAESLGDHHEKVSFESGAKGGTLTFAMLDWPGYHATIDGKEVDLREHPAGLVSVKVPPNTSGVLEVDYQTPKIHLSLAAAGVGTAGALLLGVFPVLLRRRRTHEGS